MICLRVLTSTRCQYLQVLWGYGAKHPVRERRHYVVSVPDCFSTCEYLHRTASTQVVLVQPNPEILVHDYTLRSLLSLGFAPPPSRLLASSTARGGAFQCSRLRCGWRCGPHARTCFVACGYSQVLGVSTCRFCGATMRYTECENGGITL